MRDDLNDAYAAVDWAVSHIPAIELGINDWIKSQPYVVVTEHQRNARQKVFKLEINRRMPPPINAGAGAVINSIRTSLDLLAASLARRNGKSPNADTHFPIFGSHQEFVDPIAAAKRKKWLSEHERKIIESLRPYDGGDDLLFVLHKLDVKRKHDSLVSIKIDPADILISPDAQNHGFRMPDTWPGFKHGAVVGWAPTNAPAIDLQIHVDVTFDERGLIEGKPIAATLRQFAGLAESIIQRFE